MYIPLNTKVICTDGLGGHSTCLVINPVSQRVTHLVVADKSWPHVERLVSVEQVETTTPDGVYLHCTTAELAQAEPFTETRFIPSDPLDDAVGAYMMQPYVIPENMLLSLEFERIPPGELAVHRGAYVEATDGRVGQVDEFVVDSANDHITHLVLRQGHLWGKQEVSIPVSHIDRFEEDTVYLNLSKNDVAALPAISLRRRYDWQPNATQQPNPEQSPETPDTLISRLADPDSQVRHNARAALVKRGKTATPPLLALLGDPDHQTRWEAAKTLSRIGDPAAAPTLVKILANEEDFDIRWLAAEGLIATGQEGLPSLLKALVHHADAVWLREGAHHVLRALARQGVGDAVNPVLAALEAAEPQLTVPTAARTVLGKLASTELLVRA